jgi:hypothetical protein
LSAEQRAKGGDEYTSDLMVTARLYGLPVYQARRRMTTVHATPADRYLIVCKGAPEALLDAGWWPPARPPPTRCGRPRPNWQPLVCGSSRSPPRTGTSRRTRGARPGCNRWAWLESRAVPVGHRHAM